MSARYTTSHPLCTALSPLYLSLFALTLTLSTIAVHSSIVPPSVSSLCAVRVFPSSPLLHRPHISLCPDSDSEDSDSSSSSSGTHLPTCDLKLSRAALHTFSHTCVSSDGFDPQPRHSEEQPTGTPSSCDLSPHTVPSILISSYILTVCLSVSRGLPGRPRHAAGRFRRRRLSCPSRDR